MSTDLYEALGLSSRDATPEQIRKAYRRKALQTHPDRLGPEASAADKSSAEEQFRRANNAYEVLSNEANRQLYDRHGVWPPPDDDDDERDRHHRYEPYSRPHHHHHHHHHHREHPWPSDSFDDLFHRPFGHPFFQHDPFFSPGFGPRRAHAHPSGLTDPFLLFEHLFRSDPFFAGALREDPFGLPFAAPSPFAHHGARSAFGGGLGFELGPPVLPFGGPPSLFPRVLDDPGAFHSSSSRMMSGRAGGSTSESFMTRTVNGVTETIHKRRDADGNEYVTRTYPDGRQTYTLNGVERSAGALPSSNPRDRDQGLLSPPPSYHSSPPPAQPYVPPAPAPVLPYAQPPVFGPDAGYRYDHDRRERYYDPDDEYDGDHGRERPGRLRELARKWWRGRD